ncbi:EF-Tu/IF-2/RF-3 family GTPase [Mycolicibacterium sp.]|uniref:EF-Tu/IF-2/RF-3 family GTPase n=1 Tax=Mycolicibacterium sp. TaxID=2320850 RepID=UPI003D14A872
MTVQDVFVIKNRGVVITGRIESGTVRVGDLVHINGGPGIAVDAVEMFRKKQDSAGAGDNVGLLLESIDKTEVNRGDVVTSSGEAPGL